MDLQLLSGTDVAVGTVALQLRDVGEVTSQDAAQDGFVLVGR